MSEPVQSVPSDNARPSLPKRPTAGATKAQPDDLNDVKKVCNELYVITTAMRAEADLKLAIKQLCGMGFDRNLVIDALEGADYNFDKALNFLLPQA